MPAKKPTTCSSCPMARMGSGFAADWRSRAAKIAIQLEAPGSREVAYIDAGDGFGRPAVGPVGWLLEKLLPEGVTRRDLLICSTIRCQPPQNQYPIGMQRKVAEAHCEKEHGEALREFAPTVAIATFHPAAAFGGRDPQLQLFIARTLADAADLQADGERPLVLMGGKALEAHAPWLRGGLKRWHRHAWKIEA